MSNPRPLLAVLLLAMPNAVSADEAEDKAACGMQRRRSRVKCDLSKRIEGKR